MKNINKEPFMSDKIFEPHTFNLNSILENSYEVPSYQRPYSWKAKEHVLTLLEDIDDAYSKFKKNKNEIYYTGPFYYNYSKTISGGTSSFEIIDGQQRLTTYTMMFLALHSLYKIKRINDFNAQFSALEKNQLWKNNGDVTDRSLQFLTLNSLDKEMFANLFNKAFDEPKKLKTYVEKYQAISTAELRIKENFLLIYKHYENKLFNEDAILQNEPQTFLNFLLKRIQMIGIRTDLSKQKIFEMFESINSKFKPLEEIDLIKTYIFRNINESEYDSMLTRWSDLIKGTDDNLSDYLKIYVKSFIYYSSQDITIKKFTDVVVEKIKEKFSIQSEYDAVNKLIEELEYWLPSYQALTKFESAKELIKTSEFETYYRIFQIMDYEHPKPLLFRCLCFMQENKMSPSDVTIVWRLSTLYMLIFKSIRNQDSKSSIGVFMNICSNIMQSQKVDIDVIVEKLNQSLLERTLDAESNIRVIQDLDLYGKPVAYSVLSLLQSIDIKSEDARDKATDIYSISSIDYDKAITYLQQYRKDIFEVDHIMVQNPNNDSPLKYRVDKRLFGNEYLILLDGHDFPESINGIKIVHNMSYPIFKRITINRLGNLRLATKHVNTARKNKAIYLDDDSDVCNYKELVARGEKLANYFFKCPSLSIKK